MYARRVAAVYDIHSNLSALEAVIGDIRGAEVEQIVVGGDVFPGPMPRETIERLLDLEIPAEFLLGNGDREVLAAMRGVASTLPEAARDVVRWTAEQIPEYEELLASWPETRVIEVAGLGGVLFCHATPRNDTEIFTRHTPEQRLLPVFAGVTARLIVCGHTHMQFDRTVGGIRVVNAGSVGMPFGEPGAYWLLVGPDIELRRTSYDLANAAQRVSETKYPRASEFAARNILDPPSEKEMIEVFSRAELK
jgi:predicted phosphodiesterase